MPKSLPPVSGGCYAGQPLELPLMLCSCSIKAAISASFAVALLLLMLPVASHSTVTGAVTTLFMVFSSCSAAAPITQECRWQPRYVKNAFYRISACSDMDEAGNHHSQQTNTRTENQTPHVLNYRQVLNNENTWTQGGEHQTLGSVGGWGLEEG